MWRVFALLAIFLFSAAAGPVCFFYHFDRLRLWPNSTKWMIPCSILQKVNLTCFHLYKSADSFVYLNFVFLSTAICTATKSTLELMINAVLWPISPPKMCVLVVTDMVQCWMYNIMVLTATKTCSSALILQPWWKQNWTGPLLFSHHNLNAGLSTGSVLI